LQNILYCVALLGFLSKAFSLVSHNTQGLKSVEGVPPAIGKRSLAAQDCVAWFLSKVPPRYQPTQTDIQEIVADIRRRVDYTNQSIDLTQFDNGDFITYTSILGFFLSGKNILPFSSQLYDKCKIWQSSIAGTQDHTVRFPAKEGSHGFPGSQKGLATGDIVAYRLQYPKDKASELFFVEACRFLTALYVTLNDILAKSYLPEQPTQENFVSALNYGKSGSFDGYYVFVLRMLADLLFSVNCDLSEINSYQPGLQEFLKATQSLTYDMQDLTAYSTKISSWDQMLRKIFLGYSLPTVEESLVRLHAAAAPLYDPVRNFTQYLPYPTNTGSFVENPSVPNVLWYRAQNAGSGFQAYSDFALQAFAFLQKKIGNVLEDGASASFSNYGSASSFGGFYNFLYLYIARVLAKKTLPLPNDADAPWQEETLKKICWAFYEKPLIGSAGQVSPSSYIAFSYCPEDPFTYGQYAHLRRYDNFLNIYSNALISALNSNSSSFQDIITSLSEAYCSYEGYGGDASVHLFSDVNSGKFTSPLTFKNLVVYRLTHPTADMTSADQTMNQNVIQAFWALYNAVSQDEREALVKVDDVLWLHQPTTGKPNFDGLYSILLNRAILCYSGESP
jgi:hypothetical protein